MLELRNVTAGYGKFRVVKQVSIEVAASEIVCVVGANGAGKTTLMRAISGIIPIFSGTKRFRGKDITRLSPVKVNQEGIIQVPEGRLIIKGLTVEDNLMLGAFSHYFKIRKAELKRDIDKIYHLFPHLKSRVNQKAGTLSGGEQQMLAIGRGLMARPKLFMLDEPSLGLAPLVVNKMFEVIKALHEGGLPILLVEQNVRSSMEISSRAYVLETGSVIMDGESAKLLSDEKVIKSYMGG